MGVFKWLRRERITVSRCSLSPATPLTEQSDQANLGTIRTEEYKRDLAEFQARRSSSGGNKELLETPVKKSKGGRHSLPCTGCTSASPDKTFNYEKKSASKYRKNIQKRQEGLPRDKAYEVPNVQFLFQNQVFMPGNVFPASYSDPQRGKRCRRPSPRRSPDFPTQRQLEFDEEGAKSPPLFFKNNSLPYDVKHFLNASNSDDESLIEKLDISSHSDEVDSRDKFGSCEDNLKEVMTELKNFDKWADDQLNLQLSNVTDGNKSDSSVFGLPVVEVNELDVDLEKRQQWSTGKWGAVPIRIKRLSGVSMEQVRKKKKNIEIEILKKFRHPNIILLMGFYPDIHQNIYLLCEYFIDSLFDVLHSKGSILTVQKSVDYTSDIASALLFLQMQGFIHTELNSSKIVITHHDMAKLADLGSSVRIKQKMRIENKYENYSLEPEYVNIESTYQISSSDIEPLLTQRSSEVYLEKNALTKPYYIYKDSEFYRWQAPELYEPDEEGNVFVCSKSDAYSLCLVLWECCNASLPWKKFSYAELKNLYLKRNSVMPIPNDGTYPGVLLELLQNGLKFNRNERWDLSTFAERLLSVKTTLKDLPEIIIPSSSSRKKLNLNLWDSTSPSESDNLSPIPQNVQALIHKTNQSSTDSEKESQANDEIYDAIYNKKQEAEECFIYDESASDIPNLKFLRLQDECPSSACSTPISKVTSRVKSIGTPGRTLHKSDSTEYCSILSPNRSNYLNTDTSDNQSANQSGRVSAKFSKSFTPKSYKPLHIKVPECNLDGIRTLRKDKSDSNMASNYSFDIKNYSLPNTPIARSNKLRKNAWLSGEIRANEKCEKGANDVREQELTPTPKKNDVSKKPKSIIQCDETENGTLDSNSMKNSVISSQNDQKVQDRTNDSINQFQEHFHAWPVGTTQSNATIRSRIDDDALANMSVKPLVAIHERWIYEANKKNERSMSLPEDNRARAFRLKPASHRIEQLQQSLPQLYRRSSYDCRSTTLSASSKLGFQSTLTSSREFTNEEESKIGTVDSKYQCEKIDQSTDTRSIEEFIKDMIRTEFSQLMEEISDETNIDNLVEKGTANVLGSLTNNHVEKSSIESFSRIKINGNDKPLLRITFSDKGENCLEVLDKCVNVTIRDSNGSVKENRGEDALTIDHNMNDNSLKRCQAFSALQEARSTEDLYIDDDISTQMQENFGGKVKLIPLHGSLHEILCDKDDDCCLVKVKQENGCDSIYFRCDNSDTESRDAIDGKELSQDTVVFKRSISLIEERIQRVVPKNNRGGKISIPKSRPKSEIFEQTFKKDGLNNQLKVMSNSSPSLNRDFNEVEVNLDTMSYESSSDECLKFKAENEEFERIERKIEEDVKGNSFTNFVSGCLETISEENISPFNDEFNEKCVNHGAFEI